MTIAVFSIFALAFCAPLLHRVAGQSTGWLVALLPASLTVYFATCVRLIASGENLTESFDWAKSLGVRLTFHLDGLSLLFALLICGIGALICLYANAYLAGRKDFGRFYLYLLLFMGAMLGLVLSGNLLALFVFWELTSISSFLLIGFDHEKPEARRAALQALIITAGGGLAMLAGFVLLGQIGGSYEITQLLSQGDAIRSSGLYTPILLLVLAGAFTKSAQFPFHFWLPSAMQAPTPVSAYLHSATMVKAGIYLLARLSPVLGGTDEWTVIVTGVGATTMIIGGVLALYQTNLKLLLAYSTISALGTIVMLLGLGTEYAIEAAFVFLLAHALYKGALFMVAGAVDHATGTKDVERLGGLRSLMPVTASIAVLAAVSLAGFVPTLSFVGKELLLEAVLQTNVLQAEAFRVILTASVVLAGALFVTVACIVAVRPFFGELKVTPQQAHESSPGMWLGSGILAAAGLIIGINPNLISNVIISPTVAAVLNRAVPVELAIWHGFNTALALSVVSIVAGLLIYFAWERLRGATSLKNSLPMLDATKIYNQSLVALHRMASLLTDALQSGYLRIYLLIIVVTTIALTLYTLLVFVTIPPIFIRLEAHFYEVFIALMILMAAIAAVRSKTRIGAIVALGVVGTGVALIFILFGAPDLALTQFLIETLTVILLVLVIYHLPRFATITKKPARVRDVIIAIGFGALMTTLVLVAASIDFEPEISNFYAERSLTGAHGRNIVNVILVDFRALDTLGEITVLAVAAIGVFALLKLRPKNAKRRTVKTMNNTETTRANAQEDAG